MSTGHPDPSIHILIVEDNAADVRLATEALKLTRLDITTHTAHDGAEALVFLRRERAHARAPRPDLVLLDLNLPKLDGREVLEQIKTDPNLHRIPVAVLTTSHDPDDVSRCYALGANCFIPKPARWDDFVRVIGQTLSFWLEHSTLPSRKVPVLRPDPVRILLIEDNPGDARLVREMLKDGGAQGYMLTHVTSLRDGLVVLMKNEFDAILLDLSLPDAPAGETFGTLAAQRTRAPILVLTGQQDDALATSAMRQGAQDFLIKGQFDGPVLVRALRHALERYRWRNYLEHLAHHDSLTKLPNRTLFQDRLGQALEQAHRNKQGLAVLFLDLDHFKTVNDTLGHTVGDMLLGCVSERLRAAVRASDTVARVGGDEFMLLLPEVGGTDDVVRVGDKIMAALRTPFLIGPHQVTTSASVGASVYPHDGEEADALVRHADAAMYRAKQKGRNTLEFHSRPASVRLSGREALADGLRGAIDKRQFVLHYLPIIDARARVVGMEALVRWRHPDWGLIYPLQFIPVAEETGLILDIGDWVLRTACTDRNSWQESASDPPRISINLSGRQLRQGKLLTESLSRTLAEFSLDPACLEVEVTENSIVSDETAATQTLREVSALGVGISIDDFGLGHSSLSRLKNLPLSGVKIDRSFIHHVPAEGDATNLVTTMIGMGHGLKLKVLAEGVETGEQMSFLVSHGIDLLQGHYIGKALPAQACNALFDPQGIRQASA